MTELDHPAAKLGLAAGPGAVARTPWGDARGVDLGTVRVWRGIPYAEPPVGPLRFRPPATARPWAGERDCSAFGPTSPQLRMPGLHGPARRARAPRGSEDCLTLNVHAPSAGGAPRPVLVWVHGGGFVSGAGSSYDATRLAARGDAVVVTVNYRLGPWGFLDLAAGPAGAPGGHNLALLDLVAALRWITEAAGAFGGDPARVTLFGESAGAMCVGALLTAPAARGLVHRAVLQSGAASTVRGLAAADRARDRFVALLGRPPAEASTVELVRAAEAFLVRSSAPVDGAADGGGFQPTVDGSVLPTQPLAAVAAGAARETPLLVTWCRDEAELFLTLAPDVVPAAEEARATRALGADRWQALRDRYRADLGGDPAAARSALLTDLMFAVPATRLAEAARSAGGRAWTLRFDHAVGGGRVMHGADLPLTWGRADAASADPDRRVAALWQDALLAFARTGDPSTPSLRGWREHDPAGGATLLLGPDPLVGSASRPGARRRATDDPGARQAAWAGLPLP